MQLASRLGALVATTIIAATLSSCAERSTTETAAAGEESFGCGPVEAITESQTFTAYEDRRSHLPDPILSTIKDDSSTIDDEVLVSSIDGLPNRLAVESKPGAVYQYFYGTELDAKLTLSEFIAGGGIQLDRDPAAEGPSFAEELAATLGDRATKVDVGSTTGALVWADPDINGTRAHQLHWTADGANYSLIGDMPGEKLVSLARGLVCGGELTSTQAA